MFVLALLACQPENDVQLIREPPEVAITAPDNGDLLLQDRGQIPLLGTVTDLPDAPEALTVQWLVGEAPLQAIVDSTGNVAGTLDLWTLEPGTHLITLTATDTDGEVGEATVSIEVVAPDSPPVVEITAPADGSVFESAVEITFTGTATDANDAGNDLAFEWSSSIDGAIAGATSGGGLTFVTTALSDGTHTIVLSATDTDGDVGSDAIIVTIGDDEPDDPRDPEPGEVIFSELMVNPSAVDDEVGEWVELYNTGESWLDIGGYSFHDLDFDTYTLLGSIPVAPKSYVVLCANLSASVNGGAKCDAWFDRKTSGGLALANVPDEVVLSRPDGVEIDRLEYADAWVASGAAIGLDPAHLDGTQNDDFANWCFQTTSMSGGDKGTPGAANDPC